MSVCCFFFVRKTNKLIRMRSITIYKNNSIWTLIESLLFTFSLFSAPSFVDCWIRIDNDEHGHEIKDIQITVGNSVVRGMTREQKKAIDLEACLKRRLNRDIKIKQVCLHKTSVLCWIAHGNYINRCLNNLTLMEMCIKLLPSKNAYPKGDTDVKYYNMITDWFHTLFQLKSDKLYCELKRLPPRIQSLALQIQTKKIISKCDFVLIFVTMLRSLGIQCRLVINLAVPPQQPPQKDLFHISTKPKEAADETNATDKTKSDAKPSLSKKIKVIWILCEFHFLSVFD